MTVDYVQHYETLIREERRHIASYEAQLRHTDSQTIRTLHDCAVRALARYERALQQVHEARAR